MTAIAVTLVTSAAASVDAASASPRFERIPDAQNLSGFKPASIDPSRTSSVIVEVSGASVAEHEAEARKRGQTLSKAEKARIRQELAQRQQGVKERIVALGGAVLFDYQDAYNGVAAKIAAKDLVALAAAPNVVAIHPARTFERDNTAGVQYIEGNDVWADTGNTGNGVTVAIIDTGVDYTHANFGGPGTEAAFDANNGTIIEPGTFPTAKVTGGTDLVGDAYDASSDDPTEATPHPDPDPLDCNGHGSHVAGTAAGFGVLSNGTRYAGPYDASTYSNSFRIGPGVAPEASIQAFRVFGCGGSASEEVIVAAINAAVLAEADVINMSLGSPFGRTDEPSAEASNNAVDAGVVVVASAGNSGSGAYITGSPAAADKALSVAALDASSPTFPGVILQTTAGPITAINANGASIPGGSFPIKVLRAADNSVSLGCDKQEYIDQNVTGKIVVTQRGVCARVARAVFGQQAGAAAVVMINSNSGLPPFEGEITGNPDTGEQYTVTIPFLGVRGVLGPAATADGDNLVASDGTSTTMTSTTVANPGYQFFASFTSGGWRNVDSMVKPEITAPGVSVVSTGVGTGNRAATMSGTSMAAPMTIGAAALVIDANPAWTAEHVKAALMNTANATSAKILGYDPRRGGSGVVDVRRAVDTAGWVSTSNGRGTLGYGYNESSTAVYTEMQQLTLHNSSGSSLTYNLAAAFVPGAPIGAATMAFSSNPVTVPAGESATVDATLSLNAAALPAAAVSNFGALQSVRGAVVATPTSAGAGIYPLRTTFALVPRGLSNITAGPATPYTKGSGGTRETTVSFTNAGIHSGDVGIYAWGISDPNDVSHPEDSMDVRNAGVQVFPGEDFGSTPEDRGLVFAVNVFGYASNPSVSEFDIAIDTKGNSAPEFYVVGVDFGAVTTGSFDGRFASVIFNAAGEQVGAWVATAPMNGSTIELPVLASELGLDTGSDKLRYWVTSFSIVPEGIVDTTGVGQFRVYAPPVSTGAFLSLAPGETKSTILSVDRGKLAGSPVLGWLAVSLDDARGSAQVAEIPIGTP
ncbi:MAG: S8 family serine peptidase [Actinomycetota bacterium]